MDFTKVIVPKNSGLKEMGLKALDKLNLANLGSTEVVEFRGEDVPFLVEQFAEKKQKVIGITGEDLFREFQLGKQSDLRILQRMEWKQEGLLFEKPCLCLISKKEGNWKEKNTVAINRKYRRLSEDYLEKFKQDGIKIETVEFNGNTELAIKKGLADKCVEIVCSGKTIKELGLQIEEILFESDLVLIGKKEKEQSFGLETLYRELECRKEEKAEKSYTKELLDNPDLLAKKLNEECFETVEAFRSKQRAKIVWEACDLIYFLTTMLVGSGITLNELWNELERRNNEKKQN